MESLSNDLEKLKDEKATQRQEMIEVEGRNSLLAEKNIQLTMEINQLKVGMWRPEIILWSNLFMSNVNDMLPKTCW